MPQRVQSLRSSVTGARPAVGSREVGETYLNFSDLQMGVIDAGKNPRDLVAVRFFSTNANYAIGSWVVNGTALLRANATITAGAFNGAQWDAVATVLDLAGKENVIAAGTTAQYWRGDKSWQAHDKASVGLGNVDNTSDANKPISTAQNTVNLLKADINSQTLTGVPRAPTAADGNYTTQLATTQFVGTAVGQMAATLAPTNSPTFTGDPKAPTPAPGDNDTSIATTAFVAAAIAPISGMAPINSPNFTGDPRVPTAAPGDNDTSAANTAFVAAAIAPLAPINNPTFTGNPAAPTPAPGDNDTSLATTAFVQAAIAAAGGPTAETRNRIINPAFTISQENGFDVSNPVNQYPADQWRMPAVTSGTPVSFCRTVDQIPNSNYARINSGNTIDTAIAAGDIVSLLTVLEGQNIKDLLWGTANAKPIVLRFSARCVTVASLVIGVSLRNFAGTRSYVRNINLTNAWQDFVIPIPGCTDGVWNDDIVGSILLSFAGMAGSTYIGASQNTWLATNSVAVAGVGNIMAVAQSCLDIAKVGLHADPNNTGLAPPFEVPDYASELIKCQRYYQVLINIWSGPATSGVGYFAMAQWQVTPRFTGAVSGVSVSASGFPAVTGTLAIVGTGVRETRTANGTVNGVFSSAITVSARM